MEQIFECLKSQESEASLPSPSPRHRKPGPRPRPSSSSPGFPLSPASSSRLSLPAADPRTEVSPGRRRPHRNADGDDDFGRVLELNGVRTGQAARGRRREGREGEGLLPAETGDGGDGGGDGGACFFFSGSEAGSSEEDFRLQGGGGEPAAAGGGVGRQGETAAGFSTEWAYRLAVTKLTAQLKAARERLRGEKEASRLAGERAEQVRNVVGGCAAQATHSIAGGGGCKIHHLARIVEVQKWATAVRWAFFFHFLSPRHHEFVFLVHFVFFNHRLDRNRWRCARYFFLFEVHTCSVLRIN